MAWKWKALAAFVLCGFAGAGAMAGAVAGYVEIATDAPNNPLTRFHYRIPDGYDPASETFYRVLVVFGGRNTTGEAEAGGWVLTPEWADEQQLVLVAPGMKDDEYWQPEKWSGRALVQALEAIQRQYPRVSRYNLLFYGYSAGAQCANLFPAWMPHAALAWASHASGVYFTPTNAMQGIPGLVTCGDVDRGRYLISRRFVRECLARGINVVMRTLPGHNHEVPEESIELARAFLGYYHQLTRDDLRKDAPGGKLYDERPEFIGDDRIQIYYPADSAQAAEIDYEDRVPLPSRSVAEAWGVSGLGAR